jgi:hypothetical protein
MSTENQTMYVNGIRTFAPREGAPENLLANAVFTLKELTDFLKSKEVQEFYTEYKGEKQVKVSIWKSRNGGLSFILDTYKQPDVKMQPDQEDDSDLPF